MPGSRRRPPIFSITSVWPSVRAYGRHQARDDVGRSTGRKRTMTVIGLFRILGGCGYAL